jgi:hypothetical protein
MAGKKSPANRLAIAQQQHAEASNQIGALEAERNLALLADKDAEAARLDGELEALRRLARGYRDKIGLLEAEAERAEAERRVREHASLIGRIEKKLADRDAAGAELQAAITQCDGLFRRIVELSQTVDAAWPWPTSDRPPLLLPPGAIRAAIEHELFRVGARPMLLGGMDKDGAGLNFPGGKCPKLEWTGVPDHIPALTAVLREASQHASRLMRSGKSTASSDFAAPAAAVVAKPTNGAAAHPVNSNAPLLPTSPPASTSPPPADNRTPAQAQLASLLQKQAELANDDTPAGEAAYRAVVAEIASIQT